MSLISAIEREINAYLKHAPPPPPAEDELNPRELWLDTARPDQLPPAGDWFTWLILAGRGWGKALYWGMEIPTPDGFKTMQSLKVGDVVFDEHGKPCTVLHATDIMFGRKCYEVTFDDATRVVVDAEHEWLTWTKAARKSAQRRVKSESPRHSRPQSAPRAFPSVVTTEQIRATLTVGAKGERNHSVPLCGPVEYPHRDLPVAPYTFGAWIGDGDSAGAVLTGIDREILDRIEVDGYSVKKYPSAKGAARYALGNGLPVRNPQTGRMESNDSLRSVLKTMGVLNNKHIPKMYMLGSVEQRDALLKGLMDTDGSIEKSGNCEFVTVREPLANQVLELARSLGIKATLIRDRARLGGRDCGPRFRVSFTPNRPVFELPRKLARQRQIGSQASRTTHRYIVAVEPVESVPVRCIKVSSENSLFLCSRSFVPTHNTRTGAETLAEWAREQPGGRWALVAQTAADARDVMLEGESGLLRVLAPSELRGGTYDTAYNRSLGELHLADGGKFKAYTAEKPRQLRGPQHNGAWLDEPATWGDAHRGTAEDTAYSNLQFGLRLGLNPRQVITGTPRPVRLIREIMADAGTIITRGSTYDNLANLAPQFRAKILSRYEGTRLGRQELEGELLEDVLGALWQWAMFNAEGFRPLLRPPLARIVVGVDPAASTTDESDLTGIIVAGLGKDGRGYVLADATLRGTPNEWGQTVKATAQTWQADRVIAERNNGGQMVEYVLRSIAPNLPITTVWASKGKQTRAEPVAALYEQGKVSHCGLFPELETQLTSWAPGSEKSPDRMDALVWALTELMLGEEEEPKPTPAGQLAAMQAAAAAAKALNRGKP